MPILAKVVSFSTGTGGIGTTIPVTGVGFTPKVILFWALGRTSAADGVARANLVASFGVGVTPTSRFVVGGQVQDAVATANTDQAHREDACVMEISTASAFAGRLDLDSLDVDGFTMIVDAVFGTDRRVQALCLGGSSITGVNWKQFSSPAAVGTQDITGYGFQPDFLLIASASLADAPPGISVDFRLALGAAVSSTARWAVCQVSENGVATMNANAMMTSGLVVLGLFPAGTVQSRADFTTFLADGFRITWVQVPGVSRRWWGLCLKGGNYRVDNLLTRTDGLDIVESGFGFQPSAALFASQTKAENAAAGPSSPNGEYSIGAFDAITSRGAQADLDEDAVADSEVTTALETDEVYANISTASVIEGLMDIKTRDADGFTNVMDDPDPVAAFVGYAAFGPFLAPPAAPTALACATFSDSRIDLSWTDNATDEDSYKVERGPTLVGPFAEIASIPADSTTYMDMGLPASTMFCYRVRASNEAGFSAYSNVVCCTTDAAPPAAGRRLPHIKRYLSRMTFGGRRLGDWVR